MTKGKTPADSNPFANLTYEDFRRMASDPALSRHEKVGFPDAYREGKEEAIFADICAKVPTLLEAGHTVLDIGPGCSQLPIMLSELCARQDHKLLFVDSAEMLAHLPERPFINKYEGQFPAIPALIEGYRASIDCIIAYSVVQYVFQDGNLWSFLDQALSLLKPAGEILLGDIPNMTMRKRFFSSDEGVQSHKKFSGSDEPPNVTSNQLETGYMDDSVVVSLLLRARAQGFHAWVLPQATGLPMANRREDILIRRP